MLPALINYFYFFTKSCFIQSETIELINNCFLLNIFIDHHTVKSHLLMHVYNTDTIYELKSGRKRLDIFTFTVPISCT